MSILRLEVTMNVKVSLPGFELLRATVDRVSRNEEEIKVETPNKVVKCNRDKKRVCVQKLLRLCCAVDQTSRKYPDKREWSW